MKNCEDIKQELIAKYLAEDFVIDKTGVKTVEIISANFKVDRDFLIREPNYEYFSKELSWYLSESTNIHDIYGEEKLPPTAWIRSADKHGNINSNYGHLIWADKFFNQYEHTIEELKSNPDSRRAIMVYTRPSIWVEYNEAGKSDFICTLANQFLIRNGKLDSIYTMRSNDSVFGFDNDCLWAKWVQRKVAGELNLKIGNLYWFVGSLHVYEQHFKYLKND